MNGFEFKLFGFTVKVMPAAFMLAGVFFLLGLSSNMSIPMILSVVAIAVVSVIVHELGHASLARGFGLEVKDITLHGMGGQTRHGRSGSNLQELVIILAGPAFGLGLAVAFYLVSMLPLPGFVGQTAGWAVWLNIAWSVFNLLPIFPLDGGQALSAFLQLFLAPATAWPITWGLGLALAVGLGVISFTMGEIFILFFAGMFAWQNFQMLQAWRRQRSNARHS